MKEVKFPEGGYDFVKEINPIDSTFPYYPLRHTMNARDSTYTVFHTRALLNAFSESNISLRPSKKIILRLTYEEMGVAFIIIASEDSIIIKRGAGTMPNYIQGKLSELEEQHLYLLQLRGVPLKRGLQDSSIYPSKKRYLDSIIKIYPELLTIEYYNKLIKKKFITEYFKFRDLNVTRKEIDKEDFYQLLKKLNESEYWIPNYEEECKDRPFDGSIVTLECNTGKKYNLASFSSCGDEPSKFRKACNELVILANLKDSMNVLF